MDRRKILRISTAVMSCVVLYAAGMVTASAQDTVQETIRIKEETGPSVIGRPLFLPSLQPTYVVARPWLKMMEVPLHETREQKADRINAQTVSIVSSSIGRNLMWDRKAFEFKNWKPVYWPMKMLFTNQFSVPEGCIPLAGSFPFIYAKVPAGKPYDDPFKPVDIKQEVTVTYDPLTGTYR